MRFWTTLFSILLMGSLSGQELTQTLRGRVIDQQSEMPLPGVNIVIHEHALGTVSDSEGYFELQDIPVGRITVQFSFMGYEPLTIPNIELLAAKEYVLNVALTEGIDVLDEVELVAKTEKDRPLNERVDVSGRMFTIEESKRFAGANNDISRMASNFAGVQRGDDAVNDIIIRGNSPIGLIWRLEEIDIPNPNHFGNVGATGGPVSMLNNNVLANSDFLTGAFPGEYGDGISGVFDLRMRNGNDQKHEFLGQVGFNGFELGAEGPISREKHSSYLINYRYSFLSLLSELGVNIGTGAAIPYYQDLSYKFNFPSRKIGNIALFGVMGKSDISFLESEVEEDTEPNLYNSGRDLYNQVYTGVAGVSHQYFWSEKTYSKLIFSANGIRSQVQIDTLDVDLNPGQFYRQRHVMNELSAHGYVNHKFNASSNIRIGGYFRNRGHHMVDSAYSTTYDRYINILNTDGRSNLIQPYIQYQWRPTERLKINAGLHGMYLTLNNTSSVEPRLGATYEIDEQQRVSFGYGLHSQSQLPQVLFDETYLDNGEYIQTNINLDFTKSHHFVVGYDRNLGKGVRLKTEAYYQYIFNAPVSESNFWYSTLNYGSFNFSIADSLENSGTGMNYGVDLTLEKFLNKGFYFLLTGSLFESKYRAYDGVLRNTAFNGNYVGNVLGGKEWRWKTEKGKSYAVTADLKATYAGGQRIIPIDVEASRAEGEAVYDLERAYEEKLPDYFRLDIRIGLRSESGKVTQEWALDIQNVTNRDNPFNASYNENTGEIETQNQLGFFPMFLYRIYF